jgi:outer membrane protein TolC
MKQLALFLLAAPVLAQESPRMALTLDKAMEIALAPDGATRVQLARESIKQAEARERQALGYLLPNVEGMFGYQNFTRNLAAFGVGFNVPIAGFFFPSVVGPINTLDFRATATQSIFDLSNIRRWQSSKAALAAVKADRDAALSVTSGQVAKAYTNALRAEAVEAAARANLALADRILRLARSQKEAGTGTGIEIVRAEVQVASERQRVVAAEEDTRAAKLQLLRTIGLALDGQVELSDRLRDPKGEPPTEAQALAEARQQRPELKAQAERARAAQLNYSSVKDERIPSIGAYGDYGTIGIAGESLLPTHTFGITVKVPVWDGGRRDARRAEAFSAARSEEIRKRDTGQQVELEVRLALEALRSARLQAQVAKEALGLAEKELEQAQRRYEAGVASSLEITDAQTRVARARENEATSLARYSVSRVDLDVAKGAKPSLQ